MCWWLGRIGVERRASLESQAFVVDSYGSQLLDSNISQLILKWCSLDSNDKDSDFLSIHQLPFSVHSKISYRLLSDNGVRETRNAVLAYELRVEDFRLPGMGGGGGGCWHCWWQLPVNLLPQKHRRLLKANPGYVYHMVELLASISLVCSKLD